MDEQLPPEIRRAVEDLARANKISRDQALFLIVQLGIQQLERIRPDATLDLFLSHASDDTLMFVFERVWFRRFRDEIVHGDPRALPGGWREYKKHYKKRLELYQRVESAVSHEQSSGSQPRGEDGTLDAAIGALTGVYSPDYLKELRDEWA
jgi:hypothetical protein